MKFARSALARDGAASVNTSALCSEASEDTVAESALIELGRVVTRRPRDGTAGGNNSISRAPRHKQSAVCRWDLNVARGQRRSQQLRSTLPYVSTALRVVLSPDPSFLAFLHSVSPQRISRRLLPSAIAPRPSLDPCRSPARARPRGPLSLALHPRPAASLLSLPYRNRVAHTASPKTFSTPISLVSARSTPKRPHHDAHKTAVA